MRAVPASSLGLDRLVHVWNAAYAGYFVPMSWDVAQLERHVTAGSIDLDRSVVWMDGPDPIALSLLGVRPDVPERGEELGVASSAHSTDESSVQNVSGERGWIGGFGIVPSHRGRGLAAVLMREHLGVARQSGVRRVQLEVLTQNWAAKSYERAGFVTTRHLAVLQGALRHREQSGTNAEAASARSGARWVEVGELPDLAQHLFRLHAIHPAAWTREPVSVLADTAGLRCLGVGPVNELEAVLLLREHDQTLQVVDAVAADEGAAERLVAGLVAEHHGRDCRVVNEPEGSPLIRAFAAAGLVEVLAQHEMHWTL